MEPGGEGTGGGPDAFDGIFDLDCGDLAGGQIDGGGGATGVCREQRSAIEGSQEADGVGNEIEIGGEAGLPVEGGEMAGIIDEPEFGGAGAEGGGGGEGIEGDGFGASPIAILSTAPNSRTIAARIMLRPFP